MAETTKAGDLMAEPMIFRKKPVEIRAVQFQGDDSTSNNAARIVRWIADIFAGTYEWVWGDSNR